MKICGRCGSANDDSSKFCIHCGAPLQAQNEDRQQSHGDSSAGARFGGAQQQYGNGQQRQGGNYAGNGPYAGRGRHEEIIYTDVAPRSIPLAVILTIVTCGIYGLYWIYKLNDEINEMAQDESAPGGAMVLILFIVTCGIYGLYWLYRMGQKCDQIRQRYANSGAVYLLLGVIALSIVSYALIQETINTVLE